ncbi:DeoR/GlpR family DNA-binding transcription regulator [Zeaxanthinibacter sp. PT1]|uniref:DeoR/GlpR family DNA-binding transcription regulator n=1 Tax=Zeaxanthinibacter TaxID=561554 RepID=UPI00234B0375|nr:DeoR/GlpR family DNA-binding transcription regulator [Zeaxanthinibacter sp. PT1]MDC6350503.1 DeoR/GlpR family DNA-binding transcription regulator [Zeaxanthinibacter sp. PT1]
MILSEVQIHNRVLLADLARILDVSMDTVRRDVKELDAEKKLRKVHGGAVSNGFNIYTDTTREVYHQGEKTLIAQKGVSLLQDGDVVLITGGSTNLELARCLPRKMNLTFFTPSLPMAIELLNRAPSGYEVHLIGGKLSRDSQLATGGNSINVLADITADICFLGTGYIDVEKGITEVDWEIAQMKKAMIASTKKLVSLTISEKLGTKNRYKICDVKALHTLVTELEPGSEELDAYRKQGVEIL